MWGQNETENCCFQVSSHIFKHCNAVFCCWKENLYLCFSNTQLLYKVGVGWWSLNLYKRCRVKKYFFIEVWSLSSFDVMRRSRVSLSWEFVLSKIAIVNLYKDFMDVKKTFPQYDETTMIQKGITFILFHFSFDLLLKLKMHTKGMNNLNKIKFSP